MKLLHSENFLAMIHASLRARTWRHLYAEINGKKQDITKNGKLSCAYYASSILHQFGLISSVHATVDGTIRDMKASGWQETKKPKEGAVIIWEPSDEHDGSPHEHIGFYISQSCAISNSSKLGYPTKHDINFGKAKRKIQGFWTKP
jgi:hypothetical protein